MLVWAQVEMKGKFSYVARMGSLALTQACCLVLESSGARSCRCICPNGKGGRLPKCKREIVGAFPQESTGCSTKG